jgi:putative two-component system response regulator
MSDEKQLDLSGNDSEKDPDTILEMLIPRKKQNILVVDDTEIEIDILLSILSDDYNVRVATDGESALASIHRNAQDMILLDIMMPGLNGFDVCSCIKINCSTQNIPVIFITALSEAVNADRGLAMGAIDYIFKPFNPAIVKSRIKNYLEHKRYRDYMELLVELRTNELIQANSQLAEFSRKALQLAELGAAINKMTRLLSI